MKCRLNPAFKENLVSTLKHIVYLAIFLISILIISYTFGSIMYYFDLHELMVSLITTCSKNVTLIPDVNVYILSAGWALFIISVFILIVLGLMFILMFIILTELKESYRCQSRKLKYKFDGIPQPWYRVLLSYIIVCDNNKEN